MRYAFAVMSATNSTYLLPIVHSGCEELAREIEDAVRDAAAEVVGRTGLVDVVERVPDSTSEAHVVVVYAGSRAGARDADVDTEIARALANGLAVLPVFRSSGSDDVTDMLPDRIQHLNAVD